MTDRFTKHVLSLACCALLAACGGAPASNELQFDKDGNGRFSGSAGSGWTAQDINNYAAGQICGGPVTGFSVRVLPTAPDYKIFSGACASGEYGAVAAGAGQNYVVAAPTTPAAPVVASGGNGAAWDGSTPIVD
ncbi:hypothetical protein [Leisingera sp. JC1]|uniref:hypothetical protein n=1 Tax=Leisingera sp. JC1 TaxID=1855282 RepID=UPI00080312CB|nr:hypothetical protein [Leisingera sp. JC1]OBY27027.1 hypothetical protein A9D60_16415 [Leisingera sp. JC1]